MTLMDLPLAYQILILIVFLAMGLLSDYIAWWIKKSLTKGK